jgi:hypothetical protein
VASSPFIENSLFNSEVAFPCAPCSFPAVSKSDLARSEVWRTRMCVRLCPMVAGEAAKHLRSRKQPRAGLHSDSLVKERTYLRVLYARAAREQRCGKGSMCIASGSTRQAKELSRIRNFGEATGLAVAFFTVSPHRVAIEGGKAGTAATRASLVCCCLQRILSYPIARARKTKVRRARHQSAPTRTVRSAVCRPHRRACVR